MRWLEGRRRGSFNLHTHARYPSPGCSSWRPLGCAGEAVLVHGPAPAQGEAIDRHAAQGRPSSAAARRAAAAARLCL